MKKTTILCAAVLSCLASTSWAQGLLVPNEPTLAPLGLTRHKVQVDVHGPAAVTTYEQVFVNRTDRNLEAQFVFPIPRGAAISRFTMIVNGREQAGELVDKDKARQIYQSIVSRSQDPGLLEYLGGQLFRASIFPIAPRGSQTITLRTEQVLEANGGLTSLRIPFRADGRKGAAVEGESSIEVHVKAPAPILNVYSPTHPVLVQRMGDTEAVATWSARGAVLDRDFELLYSVDPRDIGLSLVTYRPDPAQPGYFLLLAAPRSTLQSARLVARDLIFVIDTSGSMQGAKIKQAREALKHCIRTLNDGDRFSLIAFSSDVEPWKRDWVPASERREEALRWADGLLAQGGTNISGALDLALSMPRDPARPAYVVFMTDGKPTMGEETHPARILQRVAKGRGVNPPRLFTWGVGYDVDTHLLDALAAQGGGVSEYVRPEENIAQKVAAFADRASQPVLTGLGLKTLDARVTLSNLMPRALPDLFAGGQLVLTGRYQGEGDIALELMGNVNGKAERFVYEGRFAATGSKNAFVELLWAQRRIGDLLDQIRLNGEAKELVDDVVRLSTEYGIPTPYTSALILEEDRRVGAGRRDGEARDLEKKLAAVASGGKAPEASPAAPAPKPAAAEEKAKADELSRGMKSRDGKDAVEAAARLRQMKEEQGVGGLSKAICRKAGGARFFQYRDLWVDERVAAADVITEVKFGSEAYFKILEQAPALTEPLKLGASVVVSLGKGKALAVGPAGKEVLTDAELSAILR